MRAGSIVIAMALFGAFACTSFGADTPDPGDPADAGGKRVDSGAPSTPNDAGTAADADAGSLLPADAFADISFDQDDELDRFERNDLLGGGPLSWSVETNGNPEGDVYGWEPCDEPSLCSAQNIAWCANDSGGWAFLATDLGRDTRVLRFDFTMAIHRTDHAPAGQAQVVSFQISEQRFVFLEVFGTGFRLGDQYKDPIDTDYHTEFTQLGEVPDDQWARYRLYLDFDRGVAALQKDGVLYGPVRSLRPEVTSKRFERARIGITYAKSDAFRVRFDDVGLKQHDQ